jgi:D-alanyl-D-alanine carboxypeptidase (penicillin-binding protein 5/6)
MKAREDASLALLNYGFNFYETRTLQAGGVEMASQRIYKARGGRAAVGLAGDLVVTLPRGVADRVEIKVELAPKVFAPLTVTDRVGVARAWLDGKVVAEAPLHPLADVPRGNIFRRIWDTILSWFS